MKRKMESMDSRIPKKPKKVGWTEKHCVLCKKHGGPHKSHNTQDCRRYIRTVLLSKGMGAQVSPVQKKGNRGRELRPDSPAELKKALCKKSSKAPRNVVLMT
eukprot:CCRYP_008353-RA/>CCRYP_008353-RA protein AED:0.42 eAED:0.42 QI:21/1/1/1/0/0/2/168/101